MTLTASTIQDFLNQELARRIRANPRYSLRAFARSLELSPGELSEVLRGKRRLSPKGALKIAKRLGLDHTETRRLLDRVQVEKSLSLGFMTRRGLKPLASQKVEEAIFSKIGEWYHLAILNLFDCKGFKWEDRWISRRLGLSQMQTRLAMQELVDSGIVQRKQKSYETDETALEAGGFGSSLFIRRYHRQIIEKALEALEMQSFDEREFSGLGMTCRKEDISKIRTEVSEFLDEVSQKYYCKNADDVYFLETLFFRLTEKDHDNS